MNLQSLVQEVGKDLVNKGFAINSTSYFSYDDGIGIFFEYAGDICGFQAYIMGRKMQQFPEIEFEFKIEGSLNHVTMRIDYENRNRRRKEEEFKKFLHFLKREIKQFDLNRK